MNRKKLAAYLAAPLLILSLACGPEPEPGAGTQPGHDPEPNKAPTAGPAKPGTTAPNPGQQPPAPKADPGCCSGKNATFTVIWVGERGGKMNYSIGGAGQDFPCPRPTKERDGKYRGLCSKTIIMVQGTTIGFTWFPDAPGMFAQCTLHADGQIADYQHVQSGSCAVSWKVS